MDTIVRVKSVGVLGLSSKITTFVIDIELDGGKLKIEDQLLHFKNTLRTSYREYDESLAIVNNKAILSNLDNAVKPNELHALVDDYIDSVWVTDANKNTTKQRRASLGLHNPTIKDKGVLKEALLSEVSLQKLYQSERRSLIRSEVCCDQHTSFFLNLSLESSNIIASYQENHAISHIFNVPCVCKRRNFSGRGLWS